MPEDRPAAPRQGWGVAPGEPYASGYPAPPPPYRPPAPPPPANPPPPYPTQPYPVPYATPPYQQAPYPVPPYRPPVPAGPGRGDPWTAAGWHATGSGAGTATRILLALVAFGVLLGVYAAAWLAEEREYARDERVSYVAVDAHLRSQGDGGGFDAVANDPRLGDVRVPYGYDLDRSEGDAVRVLVNPQDPTDYLLPDDQADPAAPLVVLVVLGVVTAAAAGVLVAVHTGRRVHLDPLREVAATVPEGPPPAPLRDRRPRVRGVSAGLAVAAVAFALLALLFGNLAADAVTRPAALRTVDGLVVNGRTPDGRPAISVRFFDERQHGSNVRPLSPEEAARYRLGDTLPVTYRVGELDPRAGDTVGFGGYGALAALVAFALAWRALAWPGRVTRAAREPSRPVDVVAWTRVVRRRPWLLVAPAGATRLGQVVAVPLVPGRSLPPAVAGTVRVHGAVKRGAALILREPNGAAIWPAGPARGALAAEAAFVPAGTPEPPPAPPWARQW
ncbi:MAG TPA: hypothetical protein VFQ85_13900 [Mycobacteriales bacterium]|nr:hypothetical protein [Mycobacteriales bacterium]